MTMTRDGDNSGTAPGPLAGVRILDLGRILAAPSCTQILGDLGADIIKVEHPKKGDDIRTWGPPFLADDAGNNTSESGYYMSTGRNKRSVTIDFSKPEGREVLIKLMAECDVLVENYKVGGLKKYDLDYESINALYPEMIYCSVTGYGQTGPYRDRPGYDMVAQCLGGLISIIGEEGSPPAKVPVAINDIMTGMYACIGILAALRHRDLTGTGQQIDLGLLDVQIAWLYNQGVNFLLDGQKPARLGTSHPNIVPYKIFETSDGHMLLGIASDYQFEKFCDFTNHRDLLDRDGFRTNAERVTNRAEVNLVVEKILRENTSDHWVDALSEIKLVCSKVNDVAQALADPQVLARDMVIRMDHPFNSSQPVDLIGNPIKFSETPVSYRHSPPILGQHTDEVLHEVLGLSDEQTATLRQNGVI
ncbi:CoA transferase [Alphaproteobacteria bacterium]|nr:CoA transferase [Alphaproteobacteria bacterium]